MSIVTPSICCMTMSNGERPFYKYNKSSMKAYADKNGWDFKEFINWKDPDVEKYLLSDDSRTKLKQRLGKSTLYADRRTNMKKPHMFGFPQPYIHKLLCMLDIFQTTTYDYVLWLDDSCFIKPECPNLYNILKEDNKQNCIAAFNEHKFNGWASHNSIECIKKLRNITLTETTQINTGVVWMPRTIFTQITKQMIYDNIDLFYNHFPEQTFLQYCIHTLQLEYYHIDYIWNDWLHNNNKLLSKDLITRPSYIYHFVSGFGEKRLEHSKFLYEYYYKNKTSYSPLNYIGITLGDTNSMYCNGMRRHCFAFYKQLDYMNLNPVFLCKKPQYEWLTQDYPNIKKMLFNDLLDKNNWNKFSKIIEWEVFLPDPLPSISSDINIPIIRMNCGNIFHFYNTYFIQNESNIIKYQKYLSEYWSLPHHNNSITLKKHFSQITAKIIPYIFDFKNQTFTTIYTSRQPLHILIMEPNLDLIKTAFVPIISCIQYLQQFPDRIGSIQIYCGRNIEKSTQSLIQEYLPNTSKFIIRGRISFPDIMKLNEDKKCVILSHQNQNNLNNLYFDAIENGIPLIHNSDSNLMNIVGFSYKQNDIYTICSHINSIYEMEPSTLKRNLTDSYALLQQRFGPYQTHIIDKMKGLLNVCNNSSIKFIDQMKPKYNTFNKVSRMANKYQYQLYLNNNEFYYELGKIKNIGQRFPLDINRNYKVYFIHPFASYVSKNNFLNFWQGNHIYTNYWNLKDNGYPVGLSDTPIQNTINILPITYYLLSMKRDNKGIIIDFKNHYLTSIIKQYPKTKFYFTLAEYTYMDWHKYKLPLNVQFIRQNPIFVPQGDIYTPLFEYKLKLQESISTKLSSIGYFGTTNNLHPYVKSESFQNFCKQNSIKLIISDQPSEWQHLQTTVDAILAIRPDMIDKQNRKVASKLINSIRIGKPFICGKESSYNWEHNHSLNNKGIILIDSIQDLEKQILHLKQNYMSFVHEIKSIQQNFSNDKLAKRMWDQLKICNNSNEYKNQEDTLNNIHFEIAEIPKHYHMTYSNFDDLTDVLKKHIMNTKTEFEKAGWKFSFYNKKQRELFIKQNFKRRVYESYKRINPQYGPAQADFFRYCLMYHYGGVYTDVKSEISTNIYDNLDNHNYDVFMSRWSKLYVGVCELPHQKYPPHGEVCNWILISKPKQSFWIDLINHICDLISSWDNKEVGKKGVLILTGPHMLTDFFNTYQNKKNIYVHKRSSDRKYSAFDASKYNIAKIKDTKLNNKLYKNQHYTTLTTPIILSD